jgi:hypothetical protein
MATAMAERSKLVALKEEVGGGGEAVSFCFAESSMKLMHAPSTSPSCVPITSRSALKVIYIYNEFFYIWRRALLDDLAYSQLFQGPAFSLIAEEKGLLILWSIISHLEGLTGLRRAPPAAAIAMLYPHLLNATILVAI